MTVIVIIGDNDSVILILINLCNVRNDDNNNDDILILVTVVNCVD